MVNQVRMYMTESLRSWKHFIVIWTLDYIKYQPPSADLLILYRYNVFMFGMLTVHVFDITWYYVSSILDAFHAMGK
jgi:hypothetical protein